MCKTCIESGFEPRFIVILAYNQNPGELVKKYIIERRYHGAEIALSDVV